MPETRIADIQIPEDWHSYFIEANTAALNAWGGGIVQRDPQFDTLAANGGTMINMPFWDDLDGADEVLSDSTELALNNLGTGKDVAALIARGKRWGVNELAAAIAGSRDPLKKMTQRIANYWARRQTEALMSTIKGVIADNIANDSGDMVNDVSIDAGNSATAANLFSWDALVDGRYTMGDMVDRLSGLIIHSDVAAKLEKQEKLVYAVDSNDNAQSAPNANRAYRIATYQGLPVIVDDAAPKVAAPTNGFKYDSLIFGNAAIALGFGKAPTPFETDRNAAAGIDELIVRNHYLLHLRGIAFQNASVAGVTPSNTELEAATNWDRAYQRKNVRFAVLRTNG